MSTEQSYNDFINLVESYIQAAERAISHPHHLSKAREVSMRKSVKNAIASARMLGVRLTKIKAAKPARVKNYYNNRALSA